MTTTATEREIPRSEWPTFLAAWSRQHELWLVRLEVEAPGEAPRVEARELPLAEVTLEHEPEGATIAVLLGHGTRGRLTHEIPAPRRLRLLAGAGAAGAPAGLEIESAGGLLTRLRFRAAALPETLDGLVL